jgi:hypothetical protein
VSKLSKIKRKGWPGYFRSVLFCANLAALDALGYIDMKNAVTSSDITPYKADIRTGYGINKLNDM